MNSTSARFVRVAHVATWSRLNAPIGGAHEEAVNRRLQDLRGGGLVVDVSHSASISETDTDDTYLFSTLITYRRLDDAEEESDA